MKTTNRTACAVLMIEPVCFGYNTETAVNNHFQQKPTINATKIQQKALDEFRGMTEKLRGHGIEVVVIQDTKEPYTPDSIFPNNWITFHNDGQIVLYPMFAENRRLERRADIAEIVNKAGHRIDNVLDFSFWEEENRFLEGTGSMILDRERKIAYASLSERTDKSLFLQFCRTLMYQPVTFTAYQTVEQCRKPVYHSNVVLSVADTYAVVCLSAIDNENERQQLVSVLRASDKEIIEITEEQMEHFAGNMLQLQNSMNQKFMVMSQTAYDSLTSEQRQKIAHYNELIVCAVPTIEQYGGGSVRCMMAEIF